MRTIALMAVVAALACPLSAQSNGPDVIVGDLQNTASYGSLGGISAFAIGTTSCNIGNQPLNWIAFTNQHPVIGQNLFRLKDGRFEHLGMSWLKHGFFALSETLCGSCPVPSNGSTLNPGCSDPYDAYLNGSQYGIGPKYEVNARNGYFPYPFCVSPCPTPSTLIDRRLQVRNADLDPALNAGALYFAEGQYVTPDDAAAGNQNNNASYREVTVSGTPGNFFLIPTGVTRRMKPGIQAWQDTDPTVQIRNVDVPGEGRFIIGFKATELGGGRFHYEYALQNLNSDRSAGSFHVPLPAGVNVTNVGFHDVDYHSGEPYSLTDWTPTVGPSGVTWATQTHAQNVNANALRWGTLYNFRFDADIRPDFVNQGVIGLFKPGTPGSVTTPAPMATLAGTAAAGNVGANVLTINGSAGGAIRRVDVGLRQPITVSMTAPPGQSGTIGFVLFGIVGMPTSADVTQLTPAIGTMSFVPCPMGFGNPNLFTLVDGFSIGGCWAPLPGGQTPYSYTITGGIPAPVTVALQAVITDVRRPPTGLGVTNAVMIRSSATP